MSNNCFVFRKGGYKYVEHNWKSFDIPEDQPHHYGWSWLSCTGCGQVRRDSGE